MTLHDGGPLLHLRSLLLLCELVTALDSDTFKQVIANTTPGPCQERKKLHRRFIPHSNYRTIFTNLNHSFRQFLILIILATSPFSLLISKS